jgi:hypothetical protein
MSIVNDKTVSTAAAADDYDGVITVRDSSRRRTDPTFDRLHRTCVPCRANPPPGGHSPLVRTPATYTTTFISQQLLHSTLCYHYWQTTGIADFLERTLEFTLVNSFSMLLMRASSV